MVLQLKDPLELSLERMKLLPSHLLQYKDSVQSILRPKERASNPVSVLDLVKK